MLHCLFKLSDKTKTQAQSRLSGQRPSPHIYKAQQSVWLAAPPLARPPANQYKLIIWKPYLSEKDLKCDWLVGFEVEAVKLTWGIAAGKVSMCRKPASVPMVTEVTGFGHKYLYAGNCFIVIAEEVRK